MPPRRKQKSVQQKEEAERQKEILRRKEKILSTKRNLLSIVEVMIEKDVSKEWFLVNCPKLCHADYNDVIQERSIDHICGYPLCSNIINQTFKQKYHISRMTNKVYDLTERKCFCSNHCYKASNYLRAQLSPIPLYMRKEEVIKINLLCDCDNRGSVGEEIVFHHTLSQNEIDEVHNKEETSNNFKSMLDEELKRCADTLGELQIKENVFHKQFVFDEQTPEKLDIPSKEDQVESLLDTDDDSDDSLDERLFCDSDNISVLSQKHMPVPENIKKSLLIPPLKPDTNNVSMQQLSLDFVINVFKDWITEDTMKYLWGEKFVYGVKAEHLFQRMTSTEPLAPEKLSSIKNEYIKMCLKIDSMPDDSDISDSFELDIGSNSTKNVFKRRPKKPNDVTKRVTFSEETESHSSPIIKKTSEEKDEIISNKKLNSQTEKQTEQAEGENSSILKKNREEEKQRENLESEPSFPFVDSVSQNSLRKQLLTSKLKSAYAELLPVVGLHYTDIREEVRKFVDTLSLTPKNIIFKPKEWKLISVVLLRVLTKTVLKDIHDELQILNLYEDSRMPFVIDVIEIEKIVSCIISVKNIVNI